MPLRAFLLSLVLLALGADYLPAQQPKPETRTGTLKEIVTKGRSKTLIITDAEGADHEFPLTPKIGFEVHGTGDEGFIAPGQVVKGTGVLTNERLIVNAVSVFLMEPGRKAPPGRIAKSARMEGASVNSYDFLGEVVGKKQDADYPEYQQLGLKIAGKVPPIMLEEGYQVTVVSPSTELAKPGMTVEYDVLPLRGGRWNLARVKVLVDEPFKSEELLKASDEN
jgi:hypothetical protein